MEPTVASGRQQAIWEALSEAFVDRDVDYALVAKDLVGIPVADLKEMFFAEVAPHCAPNLLTVVPPIWTGFEPESLARSIREMQARNRRCIGARLRHRLVVALYRVYFRRLWKRVEAELRDKRADSRAC